VVDDCEFEREKGNDSRVLHVVQVQRDVLVESAIKMSLE
jgi:hypothetical protein